MQDALHQCTTLDLWFMLIGCLRLDEAKQGSPWTTMYADDMVICIERAEGKSFRGGSLHLQGKKVKVNCSETEYVCVTERHPSKKLKAQGDKEGEGCQVLHVKSS